MHACMHACVRVCVCKLHWRQNICIHNPFHKMFIQGRTEVSLSHDQAAGLGYQQHREFWVDVNTRIQWGTFHSSLGG